MSLHGGTRMDSKQAARAVIFDRRLLLFCIGISAVGLIVWTIALATDYWFVTTCPAVPISSTGIPGVTSARLMMSHSGLWRSCRTVMTEPASLPGEASVITACRHHEVFTIPELPEEHTVNVAIGYRRTCLGFAVISELLMLLTIFFAGYTIRVPRYTFKRVSACLYFISAGVELVVIQVQDTSMTHQKLQMPSVFPAGCHWTYSVSFILAWVSFSINIICGVGFLYTSGKKKKVNAVLGGDDDLGFGHDDERQIMGR